MPSTFRSAFRWKAWAISDEAKDLIENLLKADTLERLAAGGALRHAWMLESDVPNLLVEPRLERLSQAHET